jgi:hypothetical protein
MPKRLFLHDLRTWKTVSPTVERPVSNIPGFFLAIRRQSRDDFPISSVFYKLKSRQMNHPAMIGAGELHELLCQESIIYIV